MFIEFLLKVQRKYIKGSSFFHSKLKILVNLKKRKEKKRKIQNTSVDLPEMCITLLEPQEIISLLAKTWSPALNIK